MKKDFYLPKTVIALIVTSVFPSPSSSSRYLVMKSKVMNHHYDDADDDADYDNDYDDVDDDD